MYLADTNILLRFLLRNDPAYPTIRQAKNPEDPARTGRHDLAKYR
jgi:hypothetical protein